MPSYLEWLLREAPFSNSFGVVAPDLLGIGDTLSLVIYLSPAPTCARFNC